MLPEKPGSEVSARRRRKRQRRYIRTSGCRAWCPALGPQPRLQVGENQMEIGRYCSEPLDHHTRQQRSDSRWIGRRTHRATRLANRRSGFRLDRWHRRRGFPTRANPGLSDACLGWAAPCPSGACGEFDRPGVARKTKLPLKLHGGHAGRLTGDQGPEPDERTVLATSITFPPSSPVLADLRQRRRAHADPAAIRTCLAGLLQGCRPS